MGCPRPALGPLGADSGQGSRVPQSSLCILTVKPSRTWTRPPAHLRDTLLLPSPRAPVSKGTRYDSPATGSPSPILSRGWGAGLSRLT